MKKLNVIQNGEKKQMSYEEICKELGFSAPSHFVRITNWGTISFSVGKPDEIRALCKSVEKYGFKPSVSLIKTLEKL